MQAIVDSLQQVMHRSKFMSTSIRRWARGRTGRRIAVGGLALLVTVVVAGQVLGWWPAILDNLQGTAGTQGVYPADVRLAYFNVSVVNGQAVIEWATEVETHNQGFNLYRALEGDPAFVQVNGELIASQATEITPNATYRFIDPAVQATATYEYRIESIDMQSLPTYLASATVHVPTSNADPSSGNLSRVYLPSIRR